MKPTTENADSSRRDFLKGSTAAFVGGTLANLAIQQGAFAGGTEARTSRR